ncbi:MAG TPA: Rrf2 family transcriptional regulator [Armatimonadota bacterium]|nr:Rrf2 family transcriptional regulator [Armatimonadota bacterium]
MPHMLRISEAASLALHMMTALSETTDKLVSVHEIASSLCVSEHHLSKVCQRLAKAGLLESSRGPKGGVRLARPADSITLLDVYEAIEGPLTMSECLMGQPVCGRQMCILGKLLEVINREEGEYFSKTTLTQLADDSKIKSEVKLPG